MRFKFIIQKVIQYRKFIFVFISVFFTIILPIISFTLVINSDVSDGFNFNNYFERWHFIIIPSTIISGIIIAFMVIALLENPYSNQWIIFSIIPELIYMIYIVIWSDLLYINFSYYNSVVVIDLSLVYKLLIIIPCIIMLRNSLLFIYRKSELKVIGVILKVIEENPRSRRYHIRKNLMKKSDIDQGIKNFLLKNLSNLLLELEKKKNPIINNDNGYYLTKLGGITLNLYENYQKFKIEDYKNHFEQATLETWTLKELKKYKKRRKLT